MALNSSSFLFCDFLMVQLLLGFHIFSIFYLLMKKSAIEPNLNIHMHIVNCFLNFIRKKFCRFQISGFLGGEILNVHIKRKWILFFAERLHKNFPINQYF